MKTGILSIVGMVLQLGLMILTEYLSGRAKRREEDQKFLSKEEEFRLLALKALDKMKQSAIIESGQANNIEDKVDSILNGGKK